MAPDFRTLRYFVAVAEADPPPRGRARRNGPPDVAALTADLASCGVDVVGPLLPALL